MNRIRFCSARWRRTPNDIFPRSHGAKQSLIRILVAAWAAPSQYSSFTFAQVALMWNRGFGSSLGISRRHIWCSAIARPPAEVFRTYIRGMSNWVELARRGKTGIAKQGIPPVDVPATPEWAERLSLRLYGLTVSVKLLFEGESNADTVQ